MAQTLNTQRVNTVVIGAGQAGLSVGYHLQQRGVDFVILDANDFPATKDDPRSGIGFQRRAPNDLRPQLREVEIHDRREYPVIY